MLIDYGILPPRTFFHSQNPSRGIKQRRFLNACRYDGAVSTVSTLAYGLICDLGIFDPVRNQASERIAFEVYAIRE
jgi:hypothetical protein